MDDKELIAFLLAQNKELQQKVASFESDIGDLRSQIDKLEAKNARIQQKYEKLLKKIEEKNHIIKVANHNKYYTTSEPSFEDSPINEAEQIASKAGKKRGRPLGSRNYGNLDFESLVTEVVTNDIAEELAQKGYELVKIGEDISYLIDIQKELKVIKVVTPKYVRKDEKEDVIYQALSNKVFPHSVATPSLVADIINAKYNLDVPIYRYSKYLVSQGIPLSDMDLTNFVKRADEILRPLYDEIKNTLVNSSVNVIHSDETPIKVLDYCKEGQRKNGYIFAYVSSYYENPIYLYDFSKTRETGQTVKLLKGFKGYVVCDGYAGYNILTDGDVKIQRCFAHIRRKFYDIAKVLPDELKSKSVANKMVQKIDKLFALEHEFSIKKLTPLQILKARGKDDYRAAVQAIFDYLDSINAEKDTPLHKAVKYFNDMRNEALTFLEDGHIPISNNIAERTIKPFTIMRRNVLFSKNENGAELSSRIFTIVQTARANGIAVDRYLAFVLENIEKIPVKELVPWGKIINEKFNIVK